MITVHVCFNVYLNNIERPSPRLLALQQRTGYGGSYAADLRLLGRAEDDSGHDVWERLLIRNYVRRQFGGSGQREGLYVLLRDSYEEQGRSEKGEAKFDGDSTASLKTVLC